MFSSFQPRYQDGAPKPLCTRLLNSFRFHPDVGKWISCELDDTRSSLPAADSLVFVTFNVWFSSKRQEERAMKLFETIEQMNADFVCLQEVTPYFLKLLLTNQYMQRNYYISDDGTQNTLGSYGVYICSKHPIAALSEYMMPTQMGRKLLVAECRVNVPNSGGSSMEPPTQGGSSSQFLAPPSRNQLLASSPAIMNTNTGGVSLNTSGGIALHGSFPFYSAPSSPNHSPSGSSEFYPTTSSLSLSTNALTNPNYTSSFSTPFPRQQSVFVATAHLESLSVSASTRAVQLATIFPILRKHISAGFPTAFMGDFNFCANNDLDEDKSIPYQEFCDVWQALREMHPEIGEGWTEDTDLNFFRKKQENGKHKKVRYDRILLSRSKMWIPDFVDLLGVHPFFPPSANNTGQGIFDSHDSDMSSLASSREDLNVSSGLQQPPCWISDHFGLVTRVKICT